ncbi:hypothetical protein [Nocardioides sp. SYSU D00065]|uniref:hypothetical protein n=1 Tax=Nocardioides sp. SYSU D00065 TaxID=2817378 RepID=UPI001B31BA88|nr:hypothetical protein [Nocardioides sp. SYSU D00065]
MYSDYDACAVCGSEVRLVANPGSSGDTREPAGPDDGVVGAGDEPVDVRVCTNDDCPSHREGGPDA